MQCELTLGTRRKKPTLEQKDLAFIEVDAERFFNYRALDLPMAMLQIAKRVSILILLI
jgi:hypothetical protein